MTTDSNGEYRLRPDLPPGTYRLSFSDIPAGLTFSPADQGGDDTADSDVITSGGATDVFALTSDQSDLSRDAGLYPLLSLGNLVWNDTNNNGVVDSGESGAGAGCKSGSTAIATATGCGMRVINSWTVYRRIAMVTTASITCRKATTSWFCRAGNSASTASGPATAAALATSR
ncbi:SdrD B-like domain-containing protein [Chloroflexus sp.]|uniref:SdrD B-like domain-containing protein n=1 Tax=Chloroflexus sp. TaxID=1904827 RepID=UPI00258DD064|nr:SdrD B-like domain-containing protein [Chloroflexus sp.]